MRTLIARLHACLLLLLPVGYAQAGEASLDADQFTSLYIAILTEVLPDATVTRDGSLRLILKPASGRTARFFLDNPFNDYRRNPDALEDIVVTHVVNVVRSIARFAKEGSGIRLDEVLPMIRGRDWVEARARQVRGAGGGHGSVTFHEPFTAHLAVVYAIDRPDTIQYLRNVDVARLGLEPEALRARAIENLARRVPDFRMRTLGGENVLQLMTDDDLASSLLLLDGLWSREELSLGGDRVVAVPARGILLVTGSDNAAGMAQMPGMIASFMAGDTYPLSDVLLVRRGGRFEVLE